MKCNDIPRYCYGISFLVSCGLASRFWSFADQTSHSRIIAQGQQASVSINLTPDELSTMINYAARLPSTREYTHRQLLEKSVRCLFHNGS